MKGILEQTYPLRIEAIEILRCPCDVLDIDALRGCAERVREASKLLGRAPAAKLWDTFAEAIICVYFLEDWRRAVLVGEADSDRLLRAARARLQLITENVGKTIFEQTVLSTLQPAGNELPLAEVVNIRQSLAKIPMPIAIYADPIPERPEWAKGIIPNEQKRPEEIAVAFLEFSINGSPAERVHWLPSHQTNDLEILIRISRWPEHASVIYLSPVSIEPESTFELPVFEFERPSGEPPYLLRRRGRMVLHAPQSFHAHPYEFMYTAEFRPIQSEQTIAVAGQRTLRLDGSDTRQAPITGYPAVDSKILKLREQMRQEPELSGNDVADALNLLATLGNLMGQTVQDSRYPEPILEEEFQRDVRQFLRQSPTIGVELEEQAHAAGGRTDLSFRGVRIELKSERISQVLPEDCKQYAEQAATYGVGTNRRLAFLCLLDCSPKKTPPFPIEDGLFIIPVQTATAQVYVITCLFQGGLPKPSSLSR